ncbi:MAG TPA: S9 family peptidase [Thermoanaerobaculaceae bacterium]|nr:S9 family peptidase [Thermoanaerobaculaceae bacterium]
MLRLLSLTLLLGLLAGTTQAAETHPFSVHDMLAMDRISDPRVSPDGRVVAFVVSVTDLEKNKRRSDLYLAAVDGSWVRRLTTHEAGDTQPRWSRDGKSIYFVSTRSGSSQVWRISVDGGEAEQVTSLPLDVDALEVAPTGGFLVFSMAVYPGKTPEQTKESLDEKEKSKASGMVFDRLFVRHWDAWEDGTRNHLFVYPLPSGPARDLMPAMDTDCPSKPFGGSADYTISPDGTTIVFSAKDVGREEAWSTNFDLFEAAVDGSKGPRRLTTNPAADGTPSFAPDGKTLAYLAMSRPGYEADRNDIVLREWVTGAERKVTLRADDSAYGDRSPGSLVWTPDGKELLCTAEHVGQSAVFAVDVASGNARILVGEGTCSDPQPCAGGRILYGMNSLQGPTELYTVSLEGRDARRVTHVNDTRVAAARFGKPERFSFKGAKTDTVWGYVVYPADFDPAKKYPVAFLIHGGPQGSFGNDFHYRWNPQAYTGAGYAVVMVDFHGSTGYGQAFTDAINDDWGGAPYEDLMKGLDYALGKYPFLDKDRVGALGASYGGYMITWIEGHTDRFKCLVCHDGNLDERMAYFDTEELWFPEWEHRGLPWVNPENYSRQNPVEFVKNWKTPMLVVHGMKDFRIAYSQGLSTFTALQRRGIPSRLMVFPDENHWVLKPANSIQWHETVMGWLDQWLKK